MSTTAEFQANWMKKLVGATLKDVCVQKGEILDDYAVLVFQCPNRKLIYAVLQSDSEGNHCGWLHLIDRKGYTWELPPARSSK